MRLPKRSRTISGVDFRVHAVGFNAPTNAESELSCIANATGGQYFTATNTDELAQAISTAVETTSPAECDDVYFVGVRGSGEEQDNPLEQYEAAAGGPVYAQGFGPNADTTGMGEPVKAVFNELHHQGEAGTPAIPSMQARAIRYPAIPVNLLDLSYIDRYQRSVAGRRRQPRQGTAADRLALPSGVRGARRLFAGRRRDQQGHGQRPPQR